MKKISIILILLCIVINANAQLQWSHVVYLIITGQYLEKPGNLRTEWNTGAISQQSFYSDGWVEFRFPAPKYAMMGLAPYNTSVSPSTINYAIYAHINGYIYIYEKGNRLSEVGKYSPIHRLYTATDVFRVERKDGVVYYKKNGNTFYTSKVPSSGPLHIDCSFYLARAAIAVKDYMFGLVWTGAVNEAWDEPGNWNLNRAPTSSDQVIINACTTCPKLNSTVSVAALQLNSGSKIDLDGYALAVGIATKIDGSTVQSNEGKIQSEDFVEIKNSSFNGKITLEKTGGSANSCYGGNLFSPELRIINLSDNTWQVATQSDNVVKTF